MMQTQIPSGLQALMQASQVLSSQASPTAPGPQGPQPTVAERVNQQIKQVAQPPQGGIAGLTPNMQEMGKQAGVAGQIMAQKQAQQQQQAQNPEAVAQMAAQMLQSKGVAGLPSNMGFKEGGIIGFDGEERSDVPEVPGMDKLMEIMANAEGTQVAASDNQVALQALEDARKNLAAAAKSQDFNAAQFYAKKVADLQNEIKDESSKPVAWPNKPGVDVAKEAPAQRPQAPSTSSGIRQMTPAEVDKLRQNPYAREAAPAAPATAPIPARAATPTTTAPARAASGITPEAIQERRQGILGGLQVPTAASVAEGAQKLYTDTTEADIAKEKAIEAERAKLKSSMEDLNAEGIAALNKEQAARKQLLASKAERDQFNRVQSFFRDLYTRGDSYGNVQAGIFAREEAERLADLANSKAVIELKKAQQADKLGDKDRELAAEQRYRGYKEKANQFKLQAAQITGHLEASKYQTEGHAATSAASNLSHELTTRMQVEQQSRDLAQRAAAAKDAKLDSAVQAAIAGVQSAQKEWDNVYLKNKMWLDLAPAEVSKDPNLKARQDSVLAELDKIKRNTVDPAIANRNRLAIKAGIDLGGTPSNTGGGGINPSAAAAELARRQQK